MMLEHYVDDDLWKSFILKPFENNIFDKIKNFNLRNFNFNQKT